MSRSHAGAGDEEWMQPDVAQLRREPRACDPLHIATELGFTPIKRQPRGVLVCCPWHVESNPSCSIRVAKDATISAHCFSCGTSADVIGLIQQVRGTSFKEALEELRRLSGQSRPASTAHTLRPTLQPPAKVIDPDRYNAIASWLLERCPLRGNTDVAAYLRDRFIYAQAEAHGLGALPPAAWQAELARALTAEFGAGDAVAAGLIDRGGRIRDPEHVLVIPWRSRSGSVRALQRRVIVGSPPQKYMFPPGLGAQDPFGAEHFDEATGFHKLGGVQSVVVFCEGALDALAYRALIVRGDVDQDRVVLAVPSASTWDPSWAEYARGRRVCLPFDNDGPGDAGVKRVACDLHGVSLSITRERPIHGNDVGELLAWRTM